MKNIQNRITIEDGKRSGKPCVRGMRITVADVLEWLSQGLSHDQIIDEHPDLTKEDILACLSFAAKKEQGRTFLVGHASS